MLETIREIWGDGWTGRLAILAIALAAALSLLLISTFLFWIVDSSFLPVLNGDGTVTRKLHSDAHSTTTMILMGKTMLPQTISYPESWSLVIKLKDGCEGSFECDQDTWTRIKEGTNVSVAYRKGRISNDIYVKNMGWQEPTVEKAKETHP
jgi:hypothetical protein